MCLSPWLLIISGVIWTYTSACGELSKMEENSAACVLWSEGLYSYNDYRFMANDKPTALGLLEILHFE